MEFLPLGGFTGAGHRSRAPMSDSVLPGSSAAPTPCSPHYSRCSVCANFIDFVLSPRMVAQSGHGIIAVCLAILLLISAPSFKLTWRIHFRILVHQQVSAHIAWIRSLQQRSGIVFILKLFDPLSICCTSFFVAFPNTVIYHAGVHVILLCFGASGIKHWLTVGSCFFYVNACLVAGIFCGQVLLDGLVLGLLLEQGTRACKPARSTKRPQLGNAEQVFGL